MKSLKRQVEIERPKKEIVTREEALKRVKDFPKREETLIAAIRKGAQIFIPDLCDTNVLPLSLQE